jgi:hypothetical protein
VRERCDVHMRCVRIEMGEQVDIGGSPRAPQQCVPSGWMVVCIVGTCLVLVVTCVYLHKTVHVLSSTQSPATRLSPPSSASADAAPPAVAAAQPPSAASMSSAVAAAAPPAVSAAAPPASAASMSSAVAAAAPPASAASMSSGARKLLKRLQERLKKRGGPDLGE